ncbi:MAG: Rrf2 family transcriptional regulator, partial [Dehalococcoidia bacterium]
QVMNQLRGGGFVVSTRGRLGGYRLSRLADEITVGEISRLIDGPLAPAPCASLRQHRPCDWCESEATCDLKVVWVRVREAISGVMDSTSLGDLLRTAALRQSDRYAI